MQELFSLEDILNVLIDLETLGSQHYKEMEKLTEDIRLKEFFNRLSTQELAHKELYMSYRDKHIQFKNNKVTEEYAAYIEALLKSTIAFLEENGEVEDFEQGYRVAINLEKDTILFLIEIRTIVDETFHEVIDAVITQERGHLKALYEYKNK